MPTDTRIASDFTAFTRVNALLPPSSKNPIRMGITENRGVKFSLIGTVIKDSAIGRLVVPPRVLFA
jgi:hypothetical protein